jgi:hypothetical protein
MKIEMSQKQDHALGRLFAKDQRAKEAASALETYRSERRAVDENTARLRALRLARDATAKDADTKPAKKTAKRAKRVVL